MDKRLIYPHYNAQGSRDVFSVTEDRRWLKKTAANYHPEIQAYIEKAKPLPDLIQVLLTALGAHEFWGQNVNGDRFYENALKHEGSDYGYKTFASNANYFTHHVNKDPALAKGKVLAAVWNDQAKRVELIVGINPSLDSDAARMLDNGESLCFSMGARLPYDVCTVCGNKARTRAEYCDHLKYQINQIDPETGLLVGAVNPFPKFFDISRVLIPADKTAYMWEKIASAGRASISSAEVAETSAKNAFDDAYLQRKTAENLEAYKQKTSAKKSAEKTAEIHKQIPAIANPVAVEKLKQALTQVKQALDASASPIPEEVFRAGPDLSQYINTMVILGIVPTRAETSSLVRLFTREDGSLPPVQSGPSQLSLSLLKKLSSYAEERSFYRPVVLRRIVEIQKTAGVVDKATAVAAAPVEAGVAITKGVFAALGALFGVGGHMGSKADTVIKEMPTGLAGLIAQHPILAGILGAMVLRSVSGPSRPLVSGNFTVADPTRGLYNNDWQRRFVDMQNRPVAVIKTGAAQQSMQLVSPLTYLLMTVDLEKTADQQRSWDMIADQVITSIAHPSTVELIKSAQRVASADDLLSLPYQVPELGDLDIIKHALKMKP